MAASQLDLIMGQVKQLSASEQLQLIKRVADLLTQPRPQPQLLGLIYGKYQDAPGPMSTEEDFRVAEWHPTEKDLNGP